MRTSIMNRACLYVVSLLFSIAVTSSIQANITRVDMSPIYVQAGQTAQKRYYNVPELNAYQATLIDLRTNKPVSKKLAKVSVVRGTDKVQDRYGKPTTRQYVQINVSTRPNLRAGTYHLVLKNKKGQVLTFNDGVSRRDIVLPPKEVVVKRGSASGKPPSTTAKPELRIMTPNGGETIAMGQRYNISWKEKNIKPGATLKIGLIINDRDYGIIANVSVRAANSYSWNFAPLREQRCRTSGFPAQEECEWVTKEIRPTDRARIYISTTYDGINVSDQSDRYFTITRSRPAQVDPETVPAIEVLTPNGGDLIAGGREYNITWRSQNVPANAVYKIQLIRQEGNSWTIADQVSGNSLNWSTNGYAGESHRVCNPDGNPFSDDCYTVSFPDIYSGNKIKITTVVNGREVFDLSDGTFIIGTSEQIYRLQNQNQNQQYEQEQEQEQPPPQMSMPVFIHTPVSDPDMILAPGSKVDITWSGGTDSGVRIELLRNNTPIAVLAQMRNTGAFDWNIPPHAEMGRNYQIKISDNSSPTAPNTRTTGPLTIGHPINLRYPAGGESLNGGLNYQILWDPVPGQTRLNIYLYKDNSLQYQVANGVYAVSGNHTWAVPANLEPGNRYQLVIVPSGFSHALDCTICGKSTEMFTITNN